MTNELESFPACCPPGGGSDFASLLVVLGIFFASYAATQWLRARKGKTKMKWQTGAILAALLLALAAVFTLKQNRLAAVEQIPAREGAATAPDVEKPAALPRLLELGADKCIPCKMMAPILDELRAAYSGQLQVDFIDVWKEESAGETYSVRVIPLQIFFDAEGKELFRHEGFFPKEDILAKWKELGFEFK